MALQRDTHYPGRWDTADADYPGGIPKNRTTPSSADGTYLNADWMKDVFGFIDAAITNGGITRSGSAETAQASDVLDGLRNIMKSNGIVWSADVDYVHPALVIGSDDKIYISKQDSGPSGVGAKDPTTEALYWALVPTAFANDSQEDAWVSRVSASTPGGIAHAFAANGVLATNGYFTLPSGLIVQWTQGPLVSSVSADTSLSPGNASFPITFPTAVFHSMGFISTGGANAGQVIVTAHTPTTSQVNVLVRNVGPSGSATNIQTGVLAVGY